MTRSMDGAAIFDPNHLYRYRLDRIVSLMDDGPVIAYFGINSSTADARNDDHTVKKWRGFSIKLKARRFMVGNPFAFIATDVATLGRVADPIGPDNDHHLASIIAEADILVACWGSELKVPERLQPQIHRLATTLHASGKPVKCFGLTDGGFPRHVLRIPYATELVDFPPL